ncbi:MAG: hybrid sensor histidine kinase/response regulator [Bermanella sp.]|nr:hybrid sensor histidine kinase/response regulator [Bermanella sp.]
MKNKGWSLYTQTLILGLGPALILSVVLSGYFINVRIQDVKHELDNKGQLIAVQLASTADYFVLTGNPSIISPLTRVLLDDKDVEFIEIEDIAGGLLFSQSDMKVNQMPPDTAKSRLRWYQADIIQYDVLADDDDWFTKQKQEKILGQVRVGLSTNFVEHRQNEIILNAFLIASVAMGICGLIAWLSGARLVTPISRLSVIVERMAKGDYSARTAETANGEVKQLQAGVNTLAKELQKSEEVQQHYVDSLIKEREASEQANKAKSEFLAVMTHELRTPMNGVLGMLQLMQSTVLSKEQDEYVEIALSSGDHLLGLINDILDFSKIEQGNIELDQKFFDLHQSLHRITESFKTIVSNKGLKFDVDISAIEKLRVKADETRLHQILVNLLGNAVKFTNKGHVGLSIGDVERINDRIKLNIIVSDSGKGISEDNIDRIFDAFQQEDASISRQYGGTGLGLAISKQLVEKMNGELIVQSAAEQGSRFICQFTWDLAKTKVDHESHVEEELSNQTFLSRVLLVEDNTVNQKVALKMLKDFGLHCDLAEDGLEAVHLARQNQYDLILMDLQMPNMDGYEATKVLREEEGLNKLTPIIALTANALYDVKNQCLQAGMNDFLAKPYKKALLQQLLARWLKAKV